MTETALKNNVLRYLNRLDRCKAIKIHGENYMEVGTPDILGCSNGRMFAIELKMPGEKPTNTQLWRLMQWQRAGALSGVAESVEDVQEILKGKRNGLRALR